ncbi:hypothetical protein [Tenggerimyces flavus]|uniref:Uncharacterized protein n=1 Tax=Tenggerimyces flavus TaxID=1708749 RepID=A0ABV7Y9A0_9ACTN|nr:hypothetical protein [Tenggerimyces flavus]MBM7785375.1 hypothetical protein [Tenggerimyces flavus]
MSHDAWADESFAESDREGVYVVSAAVFDGEVDDARTAMLALRGPRIGKLHWSQMESGERRKAADVVAGLGGLHIVTIAAPVPHRRQERARVACLTRLVHELSNLQVTCLRAESRGPQLDKRDVRTVQGARYNLPKGVGFRIEHLRGETEPLLWVADIVAGACRAHRLGVERYGREALGEVVYDIEIDSGC